MHGLETICNRLSAQPKCWLVTGVAGFIGSHLAETLLSLDQRVIGIDNFLTGSQSNLDEVRAAVATTRWNNFHFVEGDIRDAALCEKITRGVDYVLHQAALGSVSRSVAEPADAHANNVNGFLNMLQSARRSAVKRFVYASSSSVYGDDPNLPKREAQIGHCLSPYAVTKRVNELYADVFARCYALPSIGLRYFNVFGPRQDPNGAYAAVIPRWISAMIRQEPIFINGDGETSRDFCYVANVVQANLLAATVENSAAVNQVYNVAVSARSSLNQLFQVLLEKLMPFYPHLRFCRPVYREFRPGDVRHSEADISKAVDLLGYRPSHSLEEGLAEALNWYRQHLSLQRPSGRGTPASLVAQMFAPGTCAPEDALAPEEVKSHSI